MWYFNACTLFFSATLALLGAALFAAALNERLHGSFLDNVAYAILINITMLTVIRRFPYEDDTITPLLITLMAVSISRRIVSCCAPRRRR